MNLTKTTVIHWASNDFLQNSQYLTELIAYIDDLTLQEKTDGIGQNRSVNPFIRERHWIDQASAQSYADYLVNVIGPKYSVIPESVTIEDFPGYPGSPQNPGV